MAGTLTNSRPLGNQDTMAGIAIDFTAGSDGAIPTWNSTTDPNLTNLTRYISGVRFVKGSPAPNSLTITVKDGLGIPGPTGTLTDTGVIDLYGIPFPVAGGFSVEFTGTSTSGAKGTMEILFV